MVTKAELHRLVDELPDDAAAAAARLLGDLRDPVLRSLLTAPPDDEPTTPEEDAAAVAAWEAYRRGEGATTAQVRQELGL